MLPVLGVAVVERRRPDHRGDGLALARGDMSSIVLLAIYVFAMSKMLWSAGRKRMPSGLRLVLGWCLAEAWEGLRMRACVADAAVEFGRGGCVATFNMK